MLDPIRELRSHPCGDGEQLLIGDVAYLSATERASAPSETLALFERAAALPWALPANLAWASELLEARTPILERATFDDRVYWAVRWMPLGPLGPAGACFGADAISRAVGDLPAPLGWLARTFGTVSLVAEQSGTAPWGRPLRALRGRGHFWRLEEDPGGLPDGSDEWVALYEADGDVVFADLETGATWWVGGEWTGDLAVDLDVPWRTVASFVLWRLLDGGFVRPVDIAMLGSTMEPR